MLATALDVRVRVIFGVRGTNTNMLCKNMITRYTIMYVTVPMAEQ